MIRSHSVIVVVVVVGFTIWITFDYLGYFDRTLFQATARWGFYRDLLVLVVGIPLGLLIDQIRQALEDKRRNTEQIERRSWLVAAIRDELKSNITYTANIRDFDVDLVPSFPMNTGVLAATAGTRHELIADVDVLKRLGKVQFELQHLDRKIEMLQQTTINEPVGQLGTAGEKEIELSLKSCLLRPETSHLADLIKSVPNPTRWYLLLMRQHAGVLQLAASTHALCDQAMKELNCYLTSQLDSSSAVVKIK